MSSFRPYTDQSEIYLENQLQYPCFQQDYQPQSQFSWISIDPALDQFHYDFEPQQKHVFDIQQEAHVLRSFTSHGNPQNFQQFDAVSSGLECYSGWHLARKDNQTVRYNSPNDGICRTLSDSSSEYGILPQMNACSIGHNTTTLQSFDFAPSPTERQLRQQHMWSPDPSLTFSLPSPPDSTTTPMQAIAPRDVEFQASPEYHDDHLAYEDDTIRVRSALPMHVPEELELSDSIATLTTSSSSDRKRFGSEDYSSQEEVDRDSDTDFNPNRASMKRRSISASHRNTVYQPRSPQKQHSMVGHSVLGSNSRIQKPGRRSASNTNEEKFRYRTLAKSNAKSNSSGTSNKASRSFPCTFHKFGCHKAFANKNEWKRHVTSQHLQLGFFRCDLGTCNPDNVTNKISIGDKRHRRKGSSIKAEEEEKVYNDFNRKDLFTQHCRRMHGPQRFLEDSTTMTNQKILQRSSRISTHAHTKTKFAKPVATKEDEADFEIELEIIRNRCWQIRRKAPSRSWCGFCHRIFEVDYPSSKKFFNDEDEMNEDNYGKAEEKIWEERMEHVGKHYEKDCVKSESEDLDDDLQEWGLDAGILEIVVNADGTEQVWLVGQFLSAPDSYVPDNEEDTDGNPRRSGLRSRDRRSRNSTKFEADIDQPLGEIKAHDSEDDASGEDE